MVQSCYSLPHSIPIYYGDAIAALFRELYYVVLEQEGLCQYENNLGKIDIYLTKTALYSPVAYPLFQLPA